MDITTFDYDEIARSWGRDDEEVEWIKAAIAKGEEGKARRRTFDEAAARLKGRTPKRTTRQTVVALASWAEGQKWRNARDLFAYRAFLDVAYRANKLQDIGMSQYQLSEMIGGSNRANWESIKRLERRGLLKREPLPDDHEPDWSLAYRYALVVSGDVLQSNVSLDDTTSPRKGIDSRHNATLVPDLFKGREGLTKPALRIYEALDPEQAQSAADLGRKLDRHRSSVGKSLKQLEAFGLAEKAEDGWLKGDADLDQLAEEHGATKAAERIRAYNERRREGFKAYLEHERGNGDAEDPRSHDVQTRAGTVVSEAGEALRNDGGATVSRRSAESISSDHGRGIPAERMETMGHDPSSVRSDPRARESIGGMGVGSRYAGKEREAACVGCGQVQTFSAPDLRPYSCAYCKGKFEFVEELAMAVA
jgi:DNA-binding MarR family transcriptional regulator